MNELLRALQVTVLPLFAGYLMKRKGWLQKEAAKQMILWNLLLGASSIVFLATWILSLSSSVWVLPVAGFMHASFFTLVGWGMSRLLATQDSRRGSVILILAMSNIGYTLGGLLCYLLFGKQGLGLSVLYCLHFSPMLFLVWFQVGRYYGTKSPMRWTDLVWHNIKDIRNVPLLALLGGLFLNISEIPRPSAFDQVEAWIVPLSSLVAMVAIGVTVNLGHLKKDLPICLAVMPLKFLLSPLVAFLLGGALGMEGVHRQVLLLESMMPAAVNSTVVAQLFGLDADLTNSAFIITTIVFLLLVLPSVLLFC